jgi:tetratricopeptide (TPR) repeat protein
MEEIIGALAIAAPEHLAVIARTTSMHYRGSQKTISQIGREVTADYVVEGGVQRSDGRVVASVQLIRAGDQSHLWANRYDVDLREIFNVASVAAQAMVAEFGIIAAQRVARRPTEDLEAYEMYTEGRHQMSLWTPQGVAEAKRCFERAVARDPRFAAAFESLAELSWYLGFVGLAPPRETCAAGVFHAVRALEIDPTLAETHALLAMFRKQLDFDWEEVRREMELALELNPYSPVVMVRNALTTMLPHGHIPKAVAEIERALEFDPLSVFTRTWLGLMLWVGRQHHRALEQGRMLLELNPSHFMGHFVVGAALWGLGDFSEAVAAQRRATELSGGSPATLGWLGLALAQSGDGVEARSLLDRLHGIARQAYVPPTSFAWIHVGLGEVDCCFDWMNRAVDMRDHLIVPIKTWPFLDSIRSDPRYLALLRRMNLEP